MVKLDKREIDRYQSLLRSLPFSMAIVDPVGDIVEANSNWKASGKKNRLELQGLGRDVNYLQACRESDEEYTDRAAEGVESVLSGEEPSFTMIYPCGSGDEKRWFVMQVHPLEDELPDCFLVTHIDITDRPFSGENLRLSAIVDNIPVCIVTLKQVVTSNGRENPGTAFRVTDFNPHAEVVTGFDHEDVLGRSYEDVFEGLFGPDIPYELEEVIRSSANFERREVRSEGSDHEGRIWNLQAFNVTDDYLAIAFEEVTEEVHNRDRLQYLATYDELTGLPNRDHFLKTFRDELERAKRYDKSLSLILLDLDEFKRVNDTYGHVHGDELLGRVGDTLVNHTRTSDTSGRYGGEEFGLVLPETDAEKACKLAERLRTDIGNIELTTEEGEAISTTCSIGVSEIQPGDEDIKDVLRRTDDCLYEAKEGGRNQVVCWFPGADDDESSQ